MRLFEPSPSLKKSKPPFKNGQKSLQKSESKNEKKQVAYSEGKSLISVLFYWLKPAADFIECELRWEVL